MGIGSIFKRSPKAQAKHDLKVRLKDAQWKKDYNNALINLTGQTVKTEVSDSHFSDYAAFGGFDSGGAKSPYGLSADGRTRIIDHYRTRQNVRDQVHESLDARAVLERFNDSVVDTGLVNDPTPNAEILGITPEQAEEWSKRVSTRFHLWANSKNQHRAGQMNFYQAQRFYGFSQQRDGEVFVRQYYSNKRTLQNPLQFSFVDPNQIRGYSYTSTHMQYPNSDGIEKNPDGTEKAYSVWVIDPSKDSGYREVVIPRVGKKSGKTMMLHGFTQEYAGQYRGFSPLHVAVQDFEKITDFAGSIIQKAINQSSMVFSVENQQQDPGNPLESITLERRLAAAGVPLESSEEAAETVYKLTAPEVCPLPEAAIDQPGSMAFVGNEQGDHIKLLDTKAPADNFREFVLTFTERISSALSIPVEVVLMKFGQNYSASRATLLLFWRVVQIWRAEMAADFLNPIYESWLSEEIAAGRISAPGWSDPRLKAAWLSCQWIGSPLPSIDPKKEAEASKLNLEINRTTVEREARNHNGSDAAANIAKNKKTFAEMPQPPWAKNTSAGSGGNPDKEDQESEDEDE
jgi:lambda family phage portal protein